MFSLTANASLRLACTDLRQNHTQQRCDNVIYHTAAHFGAPPHDGNSFVIYRLPLRDGVTATTLTIDMAQQFLVEISADGEDWVPALEETRNIRDLSNRQEYEVDLSLLPDPNSEFLFVRIGDSQPGDGWGAWISDLRLDLGTG